MGSPLSSITADIVMQELETMVLRSVNFPIPIHYRYVDNILMAVPYDKVNYILNAFNNFHPRLQFTLEVGGKKINFLDTIILDQNRLKIDWYHKPMFSGRFLNYWSQHPLSQKRGTILGLVNRAFLLSYPEFHEKNLEFVITILFNNDYTLIFIFKVMTDRIKSLVNKKTFKQNKTSQETNETKTTKWFTILYKGNFFEKFKGVIVGTKLKLAYHSLNKLNKFIKVQKDPLSNLQKKNVVYKICCNDCDASYVGQTGRLLKTRVVEHRNYARRNVPSISTIADVIHHNHDIDWKLWMLRNITTSDWFPKCYT